MKKWKQKIGQLGQRIIDLGLGNGLMQTENEVIGGDESSPRMSMLCRRLAAESCVLLKNDGTLPLKERDKVAVFGRCQRDWFYVGYGSGGDVHPPYKINLMEGLANAGIQYDSKLAELYKNWCTDKMHEADHGWWGHWPMSHPEMTLEEHVVLEAKRRCNVAIVVIGRAAGEDRDNTLTPGSFYLTEKEYEMLNTVTGIFSHTVVLLNIGGIMDMSWVPQYGDRISSLMLVWQGGMESGNAVADVLSGAVNPCGKLTDTIALQYEDYPSSSNFGGELMNRYEENIFVGYRYFDTFAKDKVLYPFGHGLSYTDFSIRETQFEVDPPSNTYKVKVTIENTGYVTGRETLMVWCHGPKGSVEKAEKVLVAYGKTKPLAPQETDTLTLSFEEYGFASYDEKGVTGYPNSFVLEKGEYVFTLGLNAREEQRESMEIEQTKCIRVCEAITGDSVNLKERILARLPKEIPYTGDLGFHLEEVSDGSISLDTFLAQLSDLELEALSRGEGAMNSALGVSGNAGAFGGTIESLRQKGVPPIITSDGPSGLRLKRYTSLLPCGTALACTWDDSLVEELFAEVGKEMEKHQLDVLLAPGMNIHRNPLCGRNFEYFSEDPLLTGKMAAAIVRGVQSRGGSCCPKHFACNNQESKRNSNDSIVSEQALREIYLRGFEICVKEGLPNTLMTSYNKINGVWAHYHYDLVTTVLRREWGYEGVVLTDWWMQKSVSPEFPDLRDNAYRVRAQVDVLMPGNQRRTVRGYRSDGTLLKTIGQTDGITRGELQRTAKNVLQLCLKYKK